MYIPQLQLKRLKEVSSPGKVVIIFGARRVGKTTLIKKFLENEENYIYVTGEDLFVRDYLSSGSIEQLKSFIGQKKLLVIDEAQYVPNIGHNLKLIVDHLEGVRVIATGSSTFDLAKTVGEPLTGRKHVIKMFPLSQMELGQLENLAETKARLESRLRYGSYPEVITMQGEQEQRKYLHDLISSYLLKDILAFEGIQKSKKFLDLLILIALQIGKEVSIGELATQLGISRQTVERYLDLLEQVFVLINVRGFSRNLRKEVTKSSKYYFCDLGIRNGLINNFNPLNVRDDIGLLWENYLVIERVKKQTYTPIWSNNYFWRTYDQKELDWVEERDGKLFGYEFKWGKPSPPPKLWFETYPNAAFECISQDQYLPFIT